jgi:hypothetical protein
MRRTAAWSRSISRRPESYSDALQTGSGLSDLSIGIAAASPFLLLSTSHQPSGGWKQRAPPLSAQTMSNIRRSALRTCTSQSLLANPSIPPRIASTPCLSHRAYPLKISEHSTSTSSEWLPYALACTILELRRACSPVTKASREQKNGSR